MSKDTGGAAFPMLGNIGYNTEWQTDQGMNLRDYFAAKALQGMITTSGHPALLGLEGCEIDTAQAAYKMADAMIAARNA